METDDLIFPQRKVLHLEDHGYVLWPTYSAVSSDPAVVTIGDGGNSRLAAIAQGEGTATITATRASDGSFAEVEVTVTSADPPDPEDPFSIHLGELV